MVSIARLIISVGGVAFAVFLIIVILDLYQGWNKRLASYVDNVQADLWVMQLGSTDMLHSSLPVSK